MIGVIAVDGGNSKVDLALIAEDGSLLAAVRAPTISHQVHRTMAGAVAALRSTLRAACRQAGLGDPFLDRPDGIPLARVAVFSVAGADTPRDIRRLRRAIGRLGLAEQLIIRSDAYGPLRAGTDDGIGVVVLCGSGSNMLGIGRDGRVAAYPALGEIAGDWGGGGSIGPAALSAAIRGRDGRGPRTSLERLVPAELGYRRPLDVTDALYRGRLGHAAIRELAPLVFQAAADGDPVARFITEQQADEIVAMASAALHRIRAVRSAIPVVLAGGVFRTTDAAFHARIRAGIAAIAPRAEVRVLDAPPVVGAALLGLDALGVTAPATAVRLRSSLVEAAIVRIGPGPASSAPSGSGASR